MTIAPDELSILRALARTVGVPLPPVERIDVQADGARVSGLRWGGGPARVVLLHGAALNAHTWDATVLPWGADAVALDLPGHGESDWRPDGDYTPATLADTVAPALDRLVGRGVLAPRFGIVGQSLGGLTAVAVANRIARVEQVVLVDILPLPADGATAVAAFLAWPSVFASRREIVDLAAAHGLGGNAEALAQAVHLNTRLRPDGSVVWKHHLALLGPDAILRGDAEAAWDALTRLALPVDLVHGSRGILERQTVDRFRSRRPRGLVVEVDAGHNVQEDAPAELAQVLGTLTGGIVT